MSIATVVSVAVVCILGLGAARAAEDSIDLRRADPSGARILRAYQGRPDEHGTLATFPLLAPEFRNALYYASGWWPGGGNRVYPAVLSELGQLQEGGIFLLLELAADDYLAVLPLAGRDVYAWLGADAGRPVLKLGTHGPAPVEGNLPLVASARSRDPYEACYRAWETGLHCRPIRGSAAMREAKPYPEIFEYLGWCSWEHYKSAIDEGKMVGAMEAIEASGLPIRYFLVDDGHFDRATLEPRRDRFPNGYRPLTDRRTREGIRWIGIWYGLLGANHGVKAPGRLGPLTDRMWESASGALLPRPTRGAAPAFYEYLVGMARRDDVDFLKVDFMVDALPLYAGLTTGMPTLGGLPPDTGGAIGNPYAAAAALSRAFENVAAARLRGVINCNWHNAPCIFRSRHSAAGRCSEDYQVGNPAKARAHLYHSYHAIPWLGQIAWGDHDMFHSADVFAGRTMAVSKAMSGGPVYLSDEPTRFDAEVVRPLAFEDGRLLRPLAPAAPLPDDLFYQPGRGRLYRVAAPLPNRSVALVVYNLDGAGDGDEPTLATLIRPRHYAGASGMIQPYPGTWPLPPGGILVYDWRAGTASRLGEEYEVEIRGFGDRLLQLSPIERGWSIIGRVDKYLPAAAVEVTSVTEDELRLTMLESGPLAIWTDRGMPTAEGVTLLEAGGGLYRADLPIGQTRRRLTITR